MNFKQLPSIAVGRLLYKLNQHPELWSQITARQDAAGSPHKDTEAVILRWSKDTSIDAVFNDIVAVDYPAAKVLMPELGRVLRDLIDNIGNTDDTFIGRVMLVKLKPGGKITPHTDEGYYADFYDRFHVVLTSPQGNRFTVGHETIRPAAGDVFYFNHKREHTAVNDSTEDRIHLIVDVKTTEYRALRGTYIQREKFDDCYAEALPLLHKHYAEIATYQDIPLSPNEDAYRMMEYNGLLRIYCARHNGELIGYSAYMVAFALHYQTSLQAIQDVVYVSEEYRGKSIGMRLIKHAEAELAKENVQVIAQHVKRAHPQLGKLLAHIGYDETETIYTKRIG